MKLILTTLNSKYVHTNLALRYLKANSIPENVSSRISEFSINDDLENILGRLYSLNGDIYGFSCYIWNIEKTLKIVESLKKVHPNCIVILGGPEVSFESKKILEKSSCDIVIKGEGEEKLRKLLIRLKEGRTLYDLKGIAFKDGEKIIENEDLLTPLSLGDVKFPYVGEDMTEFKNQILYYEASRGCPFSCSYCLSSVDKRLRLRPVEKVKDELKFFLNHKVKQVKFVDRTFNANIKFAKEIVRFLIENHNNHTNFHFEIAADLLEDEIIELFSQAPMGLFQLEVGVQSTNLETLKAIRRKTDIEKIKENIDKLRQNNNIHIHLDLIAGLPFEDLETFKKSFNEVYKMKPHMLQLGFLKVLKGSPIHLEKDKYNYIYNDYSPYEVLSNDFISYSDLLFLKKIETLVDKYNNSQAFASSLEYFINAFKEPFDFFNSLAEFWDERGLFDSSFNKDKLYQILLEFGEYLGFDLLLVNELLKFDYLKSTKFALPPFLNSNSMKKEDIFELLKDNTFKSKYLPNYIDVAAKHLYKKVAVEIFEYQVTNNLKRQKTILLFIKDTSKEIGIKNMYLDISDFLLSPRD